MNMDVHQILEAAARKNASDIFIIAGLPVSIKLNGHIERTDTDKLKPDDTNRILMEIYQISGRSPKLMEETGDDDFSFSIPGVARFRVSVYQQRGSLAAVIRVVAFDLPDPKVLGIPDMVVELGMKKKGLILVTGPAGSGKSTTLACMIDRINHQANRHVITLEDPIEYLHRHDNSIISQREIATDTKSYTVALRAALRQSPDVILLGEMRDFETMSFAMTAAETGHLIISTLHTMGAVNTIDRIIDEFPPSQQHQIRVQLAMVLEAVVSQQLVPTVDGAVVPAVEIMVCNTAVRNLIRESKTHQIDSVIATSAQEGMITMDASLLSLYGKGIIDRKQALAYSMAPEMMEKRLNRV